MKWHLSLFRDFWKLILKIKNSGAQQKESIICVRVGWKYLSHGITVSHNGASLVITNGDLWDRFFYPTLTLMIDSYIFTHQVDGADFFLPMLDIVFHTPRLFRIMFEISLSYMDRLKSDCFSPTF